MKAISIHTDGSCANNSAEKAGGWGVVFKFAGKREEFFGCKMGTTSNRMEITAVIRGLELVQQGNNPVRIYTDSEHVANGVNNGLHEWQVNGWKTRLGEEIKNRKLWQKLARLLEQHRKSRAVTVSWIRGHNDNRFNERAHDLASKARKEQITNWQ